LQRLGKPKRPYYKVVAIDSRSKRNGAPIEVLGQFDPMLKENKAKLNKERIEYWMKQGAQPSKVVSSLIKKATV
jgi:small subunit ribosomal protein S16